MSADEFRSRAIGYWEAVEVGSSNEASAHTNALEVLVGSWDDAQEALVWLLRDPDERVRYAAAASLGPTHRSAAEVLATLAENPTGLIAPTARLLLAQWTKNAT